MSNCSADGERTVVFGSDNDNDDSPSISLARKKTNHGEREEGQPIDPQSPQGGQVFEPGTLNVPKKETLEKCYIDSVSEVSQLLTSHEADA